MRTITATEPLLADGVPFDVRARVAAGMIARLPDTARFAQIKRHARDSEGLRPVLVGPGHRYAAMDLIGRKADATVVFVPGARAFISDIDRYSENIFSVRRSLRRDAGPGVRTIVWAGHDVPGTSFMWTHDGMRVCTGGVALADFVAAIRAEEGEGHRIIVDGFSLGASIAAMAAMVLHARGEAPVDALIMGGCPGVPYDDVAQLGMPVERVFAHRSANDVCGCGVLGHDPHVDELSSCLHIPIHGIRHVPPRAIPGTPFDRYVDFLCALIADGEAGGFVAKHRKRSRVELGGVGFRQLRRSRTRNLALYRPFLDAVPAPVPEPAEPLAKVRRARMLAS
ncbi:alpha/beta hydrolase [Corynebacterium hansenii]|uniref:Alpha/beta hydrolase n=1 Tax=Corynebacterium hansenii TaxID=394964 RepID=A0ABV7ZS77_9CORY|nr:alpha/beta hydrolase [Corynebacterium hansenii]